MCSLRKIILALLLFKSILLSFQGHREKRISKLRANLPKILAGKRRKREQLREQARKQKLPRKQTAAKPAVGGDEEEIKILDDAEDDLYDDLDDPERVLAEEVNKIAPLTKDQMLIETFTGKCKIKNHCLKYRTLLNLNMIFCLAHPCFDPAKPRPLVQVTSDFPATPRESLRARVFLDMWEKGYYLTDGQTFGADFLAYEGDPVL